jgi:hypothetical protein
VALVAAAPLQLLAVAVAAAVLQSNSTQGALEVVLVVNGEVTLLPEHPL